MDSSHYFDSSAMEEHIERLATALNRYNLTHIEYETPEARIILEKAPPAVEIATPYPPLAPTDAIASHSFASVAENVKARTANVDNIFASAQQSPEAAAKHTVKAPIVGVAYRSSKPGAAPFVELGMQVDEGATLCLIEAMKMFNEVKAPVSGVVKAIHFEDAALVEHGAPLFSID